MNLALGTRPAATAGDPYRIVALSSRTKRVTNGLRERHNGSENIAGAPFAD
jgi:hypothetical protein